MYTVIFMMNPAEQCSISRQWRLMDIEVFGMCFDTRTNNPNGNSLTCVYLVKTQAMGKKFLVCVLIQEPIILMETH